MNLRYFRSRLEAGEKVLGSNATVSNQRYKPNKFCLVVKGNAYGHGSQGLCLRAESVDGLINSFAVATVEEGAILRQAGITLPILLLSPHLSEEIPLLFENALEPLVSHEYHLYSYQREAEKRQQQLRLHLKVDTGMGRAGVLAYGAAGLAQKILEYNALQLYGLCTHFASADEEGLSAQQDTESQIECFLRIQQQLQGCGIHFTCVHAANTAATLYYPQAHFDMVRIGIGAYGYTRMPELEQILPVMSLKSKIGLIKKVARGAKISYGGTWQAERDTLLGLLPVGYADGYSRLLSNRSCVLLFGESCPVIGRICMDQLLIDLSDFVHQHPEFSAEQLLEQDVELFGRTPGFTAQDLARQIGTIPYEVLASVSARVPRVYID